jgi:hypothetical protein
MRPGRVRGARAACAGMVVVPLLLAVLGPSLPGHDVDYLGLGVVATMSLGLAVGCALWMRPDLEDIGTGVMRGTFCGLLVYLGVGMFGLAMMSSIGG